MPLVHGYGMGTRCGGPGTGATPPPGDADSTRSRYSVGTCPAILHSLGTHPPAAEVYCPRGSGIQGQRVSCRFMPDRALLISRSNGLPTSWHRVRLLHAFVVSTVEAWDSQQPLSQRLLCAMAGWGRSAPNVPHASPLTRCRAICSDFVMGDRYFPASCDHRGIAGRKRSIFVLSSVKSCSRRREIQLPHTVTLDIPQCRTLVNSNNLLSDRSGASARQDLGRWMRY